MGNGVPKLSLMLVLASTWVFTPASWVMGQQLPASDSQELMRRLDATERRLSATEQRLVETESELRELREQGSQRWADVESRFERLPPPDQLHRSVGFSSAGDYDYASDCSDCGKSVCPGIPHVCEYCLEDIGWNKAGGWRVVPFGKLEMETVFATDLAVSENYIVFAAERGATKTERIDLTGQSSQIGLNIGGPEVGAFQIGGLILMDFHGNRPSRNEPGAYFIRAYAELFNDDWRIAVRTDGRHHRWLERGDG